VQKKQAQDTAKPGWLKCFQGPARLGAIFFFPLTLTAILLTVWRGTPNLRAQSSRQPLIQFTNIAGPAGIKFVHYRGNNGIAIIREVFGPGVCVADFDGDGFQDIYFVNGRDLYNRSISTRNALYRNNGEGTFTDVTEKADIPGTGFGLGCVWGDYDND